MNTNVLEGIKCPECGHEEDFKIDVVVKMTVLMTDDGYDDDPYAESEWDDDSYCECPECGKDGTVGDFKQEDDADARVKADKEDAL